MPYITSNKVQNVLMVQHFWRVHSVIICDIAIVSIIHIHFQCKLNAITTFTYFKMEPQALFKSLTLSPAYLSLPGIFCLVTNVAILYFSHFPCRRCVLVFFVTSLTNKEILCFLHLSHTVQDILFPLHVSENGRCLVPLDSVHT